VPDRDSVHGPAGGDGSPTRAAEITATAVNDNQTVNKLQAARTSRFSKRTGAHQLGPPTTAAVDRVPIPKKGNPPSLTRIEYRSPDHGVQPVPPCQREASEEGAAGMPAASR